MKYGDRARLTEDEAYDAAHIIRVYAQQIRNDIAECKEQGVEQHFLLQLQSAADQRDRLAEKIEELFT